MKITLNSYHGNGGSRWSLITFFPSVYITTIVDKQHRVIVSYPVSYAVSYPVSYRIKSDLSVYNSVVMKLTEMVSDVDFIMGDGGGECLCYGSRDQTPRVCI